ncbi:Glycosyltransferase family 8 protein [Candidatus Hepatincolaceae symbiont of Richtersius coronifer]
MIKNINLVLCADQNYVNLLVPCLISILVNKNNDTHFNITIFESGINPTDQEKIKGLISFDKANNSTITFMDIKKEFKNLFYYQTSYIDLNVHFSEAILYRLVIPKVFPNKEKVLYLDVDTIIQGDLFNFYNQSFEGNYLISQKGTFLQKYLDAEIKYDNKIYSYKDIYTKILGFNQGFFKGNNYIDSSVLIFNIPKIIADKKDEQILQLMSQHSNSLIFADQDILTKSFLYKVKDLKSLNKNKPSVYAILESNLFRSEEHKDKFLDEKIKNALILHYISKPTKLRKIAKHANHKIYYKYLQMSYLALPNYQLFWINLITLWRKIRFYCFRIQKIKEVKKSRVIYLGLFNYRIKIK